MDRIAGVIGEGVVGDAVARLGEGPDADFDDQHFGAVGPVAPEGVHVGEVGLRVQFDQRGIAVAGSAGGAAAECQHAERGQRRRSGGGHKSLEFHRVCLLKKAD